MEQMFSNATVMLDEHEIIERDALVSICSSIIKTTWSGINPAIRFRRVETPILTPMSELSGHVGAGFKMLETSRGILRPETTAGCISAFHQMFPQQSQLKKALPFCVWQFGKSFRDEENPSTMRASRLRLVEFHQLEFELFCSSNTMSDYLTDALMVLRSRFGGEVVEAEELPHYSRRTLDWEIDGVEVAGCSERTDWSDGIIYEISIGIDRLLNKVLNVFKS